MKRTIQNLLAHAIGSEKIIEQYLVERTRLAGGVCLKYSNPNMVGYPDRVVLLPEGETLWVELKSKGKKVRVSQEIRIKQLQNLGHRVFVLDSKTAVDSLLNPYIRNAQ